MYSVKNAIFFQRRPLGGSHTNNHQGRVNTCVVLSNCFRFIHREDSSDTDLDCDFSDFETPEGKFYFLLLYVTITRLTYLKLKT